MPSVSLAPAQRLTVSVDDITETEWNSLLGQFADASIYQTWAYGAVHWGRKQLSHLVLKRNDEVIAAAQVRIVQIPIIKKGVAYLRWGPLWRRNGTTADIEIFNQALNALKAEYVEKRGLLLRILPNVFQEDPIAPAASSSWKLCGLELQDGTKPYHTSRIDVAQPVDDLRKQLQSRWRNYLKAGEKAGFTVVQGTADELYDQFTVLYREMMARKQFETTVDVEQFRQIQRRLPAALKMQVFVCSAANGPHNALVVSAAGDTGIYLLAATGNAGLNGRGAYLLQWRAMEWLHQQGICWYDTGGINQEKNPGGYQFKSGLGGQEVSHLGRFELRGNWLSSQSVMAAEKLQAWRHSLKSRYESRRATVEKPFQPAI
jgi:lipid II:glycine glycyltransferase (peptidoglycan interpeptide bridge formation enzyme)